jgi:hypothetical protein
MSALWARFSQGSGIGVYLFGRAIPTLTKKPKQFSKKNSARPSSRACPTTPKVSRWKFGSKIKRASANKAP